MTAAIAHLPEVDTVPGADGLQPIVVGGPGGPASVKRRELWRWFVRQRTPRLMAGFVALNVANRARHGRLGWPDAAAGVGVVVAQPFTELVLHTRLLHRAPTTWRGHTIDPVASRDHRAHHRDPKDLHYVFVPMPTLLAGFGAFAAGVALARHGRAPLASGGVAGAAMLGAYEWCHFLMHTGYQPKGRWFRSRWRTHRLHHYRNEHYWFGVLTHLGDQVNRTYPAKSAVPLSPTARSLHAAHQRLIGPKGT
ncbi:MAG: sterol desaturase family protein [Acidimicrobiales bacterium]